MFYFTPSEGDLLLCDVTVEYTDASGKLQTETITGEWKKQIKFASLPANGTIAIKRSLKANVELAKDHYKFGYTEQSVFMQIMQVVLNLQAIIMVVVQIFR